MIAQASCPSHDELEQYLRAQLPDEDSAVLETHLSWCGSCAHSVHELSVRDTLIVALRAQAVQPEDSDQAVVDVLIARLCQALPGMVGSSSPASTAAIDSGERVNVSESTQELFDFLAPALEPDEIGRLGPFRVLGLIGSGGMGVVFRAEDPHLKRIVALKAIKRSLAASEMAHRRFLREARAVAALAHDHVVPVYQAGEDRGVLYLAMPLLAGESLDARLEREGRLPLREALRIAREAAEGLAAAHARGLIHRDVKPANIWLEEVRGRVKLLDFGLARAMDETEAVTQSGTIAGTPQYMSPEQARGGEITPGCDLFSLGCVLYHMLAGRPPFRGADTIATLLAVATEEPIPPAKLAPDVPRGVSDLTIQLLAKGPAGRPASALAVVEAIEALERAPAAPAPPPLPHFPRRGWFVIAAAAALAALAAPVIYIKTDQGRVEIHVDPSDVNITIDEANPTGERKRTEEGVAITVRTGVHTVTVTKKGFEPFDAQVRILRGKTEPVNPVFRPTDSKPAAATSEAPKAAVADTYDPEFSGLVPRPPALPGIYRWQLETRASRGFLDGVAWSPDGRRVCCGGTDERLRVYDAETMRLLVAWPVRGITALDWSPDGRRIVTGGAEGTIRLWDADDGTPGPLVTSHHYSVMGVAFRPDSRFVASLDPDTKSVRLWDLITRSAGAVLSHPEVPTDLAWSPDGKTLATACADKVIRLWDTKATVHRTFAGPAAVVRALAFTADGRRLVSAGDDRKVRVWNLENGAEEQSWDGGNMAVAVSRDGVVASVSLRNPEITLRDLSGNTPTRTCKGHSYQFYDHALQFRPDGRLLASVNQDGTLRLWDARSGVLVRTLERHHEEITRLAFDAAGETLATAGQFVDAARLWSVSDGSLRRTLRIAGARFVSSVAFSPDGREVAAGGADMPGFDGIPPVTDRCPVQLWSTGDGKPGPTLSGHIGGVRAVAYPPDGNRVVSSGGDGTIRFWDRRSGVEKAVLNWDHMPEELEFSADGRRFWTWGWPGVIRSWDAKSGGSHVEFRAGTDSNIESVAYHPAGKMIATGEFHGIRCRDADTGAVVREYREPPTWGVAISPDGRLLAAAHWDGRITVRGWDGESLEIKSLRTTVGTIRGLRFGPDSHTLASSGRDGAIRLWDVRSGIGVRTIIPLRGDRWAVTETGGRLRVSDPSAEDELVYLVREKEDGPIRCLSPAEFRARFQGSPAPNAGRRIQKRPPGAEPQLDRKK